MRGRRTWVLMVAALGLTASFLPAAAATRPAGVVITAPAGSVATVTLKSFLPLSNAQGSIDILGASSGDLAGAALIGRGNWGVQVSTLNARCKFVGKCTDLPEGNSFGTEESGKFRGLSAGTYNLIILGRPGAKVSLRLRNALAGQPLRFTTKSRVQVRELDQRYPATPDKMPEAYFDEQLTGPTGKNVTVLVAHLDAGRPKTLQFDGCLRHGALPAVQVPRYGSACIGDDGDEAPGGATGAVSVGGKDCSTVPPPVCFPVTMDAFHLSYAYAQVFSSPPHVSLTADILAVQSGVLASALTFTLP